VWPKNTFLDQMGPAAGEELLAMAAARPYERGETLIRQGAHDTHVYLLRSTRADHPACVKVVGMLEDGQETLLGIRVSGDVVGELAALSEMPRSASVIACSDLLAHVIPADRFANFLNATPGAWMAIMHMVANRLVLANRHRLEFVQHGVTARLAHALAHLVERHGRPQRDGYDLGVALAQAELGQLVGARNDAVGKALRTLREQGLIKSGYRRIVVIDPIALRTYSGE
jgi:CRP-like cAMP-binding protein